MSAMRQIAEVQDKFFPERVEKIFIIAPKAFAIFWRLVRSFVPTKTLQKMEGVCVCVSLCVCERERERERERKRDSLVHPKCMDTRLPKGSASSRTFLL